ncbi:hypothetical protein ACOZ4I_19880 (plasmid) [Haloarcula salina]|uniref:hypothetical protein n=1 Tax=Haloarcula salina TaxID=1429914 RepID=UPI003C6F41AD
MTLQAESEPNEDRWPDTCRNAPLVEPDTTISGFLDVPRDVDRFRTKVTRGDVITYSTRAAEGHSEFATGIAFGAGATSVQDSNTDDPDVSVRGNRIIIGATASGGSGNYVSLIADRDEILCFSATESEPAAASFPYEWEFTVTKGQNSVSRLRESPSQDDINDLESTVESQAERIEELEATVEEQRDRIEVLEQEVENKNETVTQLQRELNSSSGSGGVVLEIEVAPSGQSNSFTSGEIALVTVSGESAAVEEVSVIYGEGTYLVGADGEVEIPLMEAGKQEMRFQYRETTDNVVLDVQQREGSSDTTAENTGGTGASGPGFGVTTVLLAAALLGWLTTRAR